MNENEMRPAEAFSNSLRRLYREFGYETYKVSRFEEYDLYMRNRNFLKDDRLLTFTDLTGQLMALKPDVTLSVVRSVRDEDTPVKVCYAESVYRVPRGENSFREIMQTGIEAIGAGDRYTQAEVLSLAAGSLQILGKNCCLDLSDLRICQAILEESGFEGEDARQALTAVSSKERHVLRDLCEKKEITGDRRECLDALITCSGPVEPTLERFLALPLPEGAREAALELQQLMELIPGEMRSCMNLDFSVLSDMAYYSGLTFAGFVEGIPEAVLSGGCYDPLLRRLGRSSSGIGFAVYLNDMDRLNKGPASQVDLRVRYAPDADPARVMETVTLARRQGERVLAVLDKTVPDGQIVCEKGGKGR